MDMIYIINKLQEVEKLKQVLLNEDQLRLFDYLPKPVISEDVEKLEEKH